MLSGIEERPGQDALHTRLVYEVVGFGRDAACVTVVASLAHMDLDDAERVTDWRAYWHAFLEETPHEVRIDWCARHGAKLTEAMARAIFSWLEDAPYNA